MREPFFFLCTLLLALLAAPLPQARPAEASAAGVMAEAGAAAGGTTATASAAGVMAEAGAAAGGTTATASAAPDGSREAERADRGRTLSGTERARLSGLIRAYLNEKNLSKRSGLSREILDFGPEGASLFLESLDKDFAKALREYRKKLDREAGILFKKRIKKAKKPRIEALRKKINALKKRPKLTKKEIVEEGDPALEELKRLLLVDAFELSAATSEIVSMRDRLAEEAAARSACRRLVAAGRLSGKGRGASKGGDDGNTGRSGGAGKQGAGKGSAAGSSASGGGTGGEGWAGKEIAWAEETAAARPLFLGAGQKAVLADNIEAATRLDPAEAEGILDLNVLRLLLGLKPLRVDLKLCAAARDHSHDMRTLHFFAHDSPVKGKETPFKRASNFGTSASAENIFVGSASGPKANLAWFHSPGHHKNMLHSGWTFVGLGRSGTYWSQEFR